MVPNGGGISVTLGGTSILNNVIGGDDRDLVFLNYGQGNYVVQGNFIGVGADGATRLAGARAAIRVSNSAGVRIGGIEAGQGNVIAFAERSTVGEPPASGVIVGNNVSKVAINGNSIFGNIALGIDLRAPFSDDASGVTRNDLYDNDTGANQLQNFPILTSVAASGATVRITGTLNSGANKAYRVELFGNEAADPTGYGEGQVYLGFVNVTTDVAGNASFDVTLPRPQNATAYSATATDPNGNTSEFGPTFFGRLQNISTRARIQTGDNIMIGGFIVTGADPKRVIVRAVGPSLEISGVPFAGRLEDPVLDLYDRNGLLLGRNDNWRDAQQAEIEQSGLPPEHERESAIIRTLLPGSYTASMYGKDGSTGVGVVEAYDLDPAPASRLANISTRAFVETGENVMIGGFIIGPGEGGARVLVRGIGPSLASSGVPNPMQDPTVELRDGNGALRAQNDDWRQNQAQVQPTGAAPIDDREAALVADLSAANYTAVLRGKADTTGVALVEVYHLQ